MQKRNTYNIDALILPLALVGLGFTSGYLVKKAIDSVRPIRIKNRHRYIFFDTPQKYEGDFSKR